MLLLLLLLFVSQASIDLYASGRFATHILLLLLLFFFFFLVDMLSFFRGVKQRHVRAKSKPASSPAGEEEAPCRSRSSNRRHSGTVSPAAASEGPNGQTQQTQRTSASTRVSQQQQQQLLSSTPRLSLIGARVRRTSQRAVHLSNDEAFTHYLRRASRTSEERRPANRQTRPSPVKELSSSVDNDCSSRSRSSSDDAAVHVQEAADKKREEERSVDRRTESSPARHTRSSQRAATTRTTPTRSLPSKAGAVAFSSSSSESESEYGQGEWHGSSRRVVAAPPLIDARKVFKISPDRTQDAKQELRVSPSPRQFRTSPSPLEEAENAWTFPDASAHVTSHRLQRHTHIHQPHYKSSPAPSPVGTRRLHTAWTSYLQQHGQSSMYGHDDHDDSGNDGSGACRHGGHRRTPSQQWLSVQGEMSGALVVQPDEGILASSNNNNNNNSHGTAHDASSAAMVALKARLQDSEKEVLLLRASLLMTYTLLATGGEKKKAQRLAGSAAARRWERSVGSYAGWTQAAEQRTATTSDEKDRRATSPFFSTRVATPWPGLEARLADAVFKAAQQLAGVSSPINGGSAQRRSPAVGPEGHETTSAATSLLASPPPRLLLRETPSHDMRGLPSLWYPPHLSDAIAPVTGVLSVWFSGGENGDDDDEESDDNRTSHESSAEEEEDVDVSDANTRGSATRERNTHRRSRSGLLSVFSRSNSAARSRSSQRSSARKRQRRVASSSSASPSSAEMRGAWRRCFVVADDHGVLLYPSEDDYADFASERLLLALPYASLAYLIPDFVDAAAAANGAGSGDGGKRGTGGCVDAAVTSTLAAVHVATITTVGAHLCQRRVDDVAPYVYFGFVRRQTPAVEQRVAAAAASAGANVVDVLRQRETPFLRFAPWRVSTVSPHNGKRSRASSSRRHASQRLHPPLVFRTQSRLAHAEWVHYFAYKFNRHLYGLLFPTTCAAMAEVGLRNAAAQTDVSGAKVGMSSFAPERQEKRNDMQQQQQGPAEQAGSDDDGQHRHSRRHRSHRRHRLHQGNRDTDNIDASEDVRSDRSTRHRRRGRNSSNSSSVDGDKDDGAPANDVSLTESPTRLSAPPSPPDVTNQFSRALQHTIADKKDENEAQKGDAASLQDREALMQLVRELRRTLEQRDRQLQGLEDEQTALTKTLRQREHQVQELQLDQRRLRDELHDAASRQERQHGVAESQRDEPHRLHAAADAVQTTPATAAGQQRDDDELAQTIREIEAGHRRESTFLRDQLEDLQRRYRADQAAWRAEQQTLETRCRMAEVEAQNLRKSASHQIRSLADQVVRDLDDFHDEVKHGAERCMSSMLPHSQHGSTTRQLRAPPHLYDSDASTPPRSPRTTTTTVVAAPAHAIASLLLSYDDRNGHLVDGELTVVESAARLLYSGPTANQRGRRWELRHHDTDALLRIQLELLSRASGDPHTPSHAPPAAILQGRSLLSPPPAETRRRSAMHTPLSAVLRAVNVAPRDTRASRLRQAAVERQIQEREALDNA